MTRTCDSCRGVRRTWELGDGSQVCGACIALVMHQLHIAEVEWVDGPAFRDPEATRRMIEKLLRGK